MDISQLSAVVEQLVAPKKRTITISTLVFSGKEFGPVISAPVAEKKHVNVAEAIKPYLTPIGRYDLYKSEQRKKQIWSQIENAKAQLKAKSFNTSTLVFKTEQPYYIDVSRAIKQSKETVSMQNIDNFIESTFLTKMIQSDYR